MPMMKSPYNQTVSSLFGHVLNFEANVPLYVPDRLLLECQKVGIQLTEDQPPVVVAPEKKSDNGEDIEEGFKTALDSALLKLLARNDPSDLKADLSPKLNKVVVEMSPDLRRPNATEVSDAYQRLQGNIDLAE